MEKLHSYEPVGEYVYRPDYGSECTVTQGSLHAIYNYLCQSTVCFHECLRTSLLNDVGGVQLVDPARHKGQQLNIIPPDSLTCLSRASWLRCQPPFPLGILLPQQFELPSDQDRPSSDQLEWSPHRFDPMPPHPELAPRQHEPVLSLLERVPTQLE